MRAKYIVLTSVLGTIGLSLSIVLWPVIRLLPPCLPHPSFKLDVTQTDWVVQRQSLDCEFQNVSLRIEILEKRSGKVLVLADGSDVWQATITSGSPSRIDITIPNRSDVILRSIDTPPIEVHWHFTPRDDPEERERWVSWRRDPSNEANRTWYCEHIYERTSGDHVDISNLVLGKMWVQPYGVDKPYCR